MTVWIDERAGEHLEPEWKEVISQVAEKSLRLEEFDKECEISVSIVDNKEIQEINKKFREIDKPTDVLSFPMLTFEEGEIADTNEKGEVILGDIIISLERAKEQAVEYGHSLKREIAFLTAHSMLHLLGYDHIAAEEEQEMIQKQKEILESLGISREE